MNPVGGADDGWGGEHAAAPFTTAADGLPAPLVHPLARPPIAVFLVKVIGAMDLVAVLLGGIPVCPGAGALAAQCRFGARTAAGRTRSPGSDWC
ncbi:MAG: molybdate transporter family protein [Methanoregulaceae archaeon]